MPAPLVPVIDNFNRSEATLATGTGVTWTAFRATGVAPETGAANGSELVLATAVAIRGAKESKSFSGHQQVAVTISGIGNKWLELWMASASGENGYSLEYVTATHEFILLRNHATQVSTKTTTFTLAAGDKIFLDYVEATGVVTAWYEHAGEWKEIFKFTDGAPITGGGVAGFAARTDTTGWTLDDFRAGAVAEVTKPAAKETSAKVAISTVKILGSNLATLTATNLPAGLTLTKVTEAEWTITGEPTTVKGLTSVTLEPKSSATAGEVGENVSFNWTVTAKPKLTKPADQVSTQGSAITPFTPVAEGANLTWSALVKPLPAGLSINPSTGEISGTPSASEGIHVVQVKIESANGGSDTVNFEWTVNASGGSEGEATAPANQTTEQGATVNLSVTTANAATMTASELPAGLELAKSTESLWKIEGKPTTAKAVVTVTLKPRNGSNVGKDVTFTWKINELKPTLVKPSDQTFSTSGAITPLIITGTNIGVIKGAPSVPAGLTLTKKSSTELELKGTPTTVKAITAYTFEVETTDKTGTASTGAFNITIISGPAEPAGTYKFKLHGTTTKRIQFWKENGVEVNFTVSSAAAYGTNDPIEAGALEELVEGGQLDTWP